MIYKEIKDNFLISTDKSLLDIAVIHAYLATQSYWAQNIPVEIVNRSIENSFCFGIYTDNKQIGFARLITDYATFAYLADVFILPTYQGNGLSKWLIKFILDIDLFKDVRRWLLTTKDAQGLYAQFGFVVHNNPERVMYINTKYNENYVPVP